MASSQRSSLPFARRYTLQTLQTLKHPLGMPNPAANRHPKATSMASYGCPSLPFARPSTLKRLKTLKTLQTLLERPTAQAKATPRPHPWLLLSGPACRSRGVTRFKPSKHLNILLACLIPQPTGTPRRHQWLLVGVQEPPSFRCHRCQTPTSCAFRFSETRRAAWRLAAEMAAVTAPHKEEGVGGTRALAHSIYQCFWMAVCKKTM